MLNNKSLFIFSLVLIAFALSVLLWGNDISNAQSLNQDQTSFRACGGDCGSCPHPCPSKSAVCGGDCGSCPHPCPSKSAVCGGDCGSCPTPCPGK